MRISRLIPYCLLSLLSLFFVLGFFWQPYDPDMVDLGNRYASSSFSHWLGTDHLGRDLLSRIMVGGWRTGSVVVCVMLVGFTGGALLGTMAAVLNDWRGSAILRLCEMSIVIPTLIIALTAAAIFGLTPLSASLALGLAGVGPHALLAHTLTRRILGRPFVQAAHALGVGRIRLILRHILPNSLPVMLTYVGSQAGMAVVAYASLAFIGLGADPSKPDWGSMLFEYRMFIFDYPMLMIWPGMAIAVTTGLLNWIFDPETEAESSLKVEQSIR